MKSLICKWLFVAMCCIVVAILVTMYPETTEGENAIPRGIATTTFMIGMFAVIYWPKNNSRPRDEAIGVANDHTLAVRSGDKKSNGDTAFVWGPDDEGWRPI